jgi:hypothetical protein
MQTWQANFCHWMLLQLPSFRHIGIYGLVDHTKFKVTKDFMISMPKTGQGVPAKRKRLNMKMKINQKLHHWQ